MTSVFSKNKKVAQEPSASVSLMFLIHFDLACSFYTWKEMNNYKLAYRLLRICASLGIFQFTNATIRLLFVFFLYLACRQFPSDSDNRKWRQLEGSRLENLFDCSSPVARGAFSSETSLLLFAALSHSQGYPSARFARRHFFYLIPFFAFSPHCGAWSQPSGNLH